MLKPKIKTKLIFFILFLFLKVFGTKYHHSTIFGLCEKCEEKSKICYEMEKKKFCPRCTLGQLSFFFPSHTMKEIKFYMTDIIFHQMNEKKIKKTKRTSWSNINQVLNEKINTELKILEKRKESNQSFDLFTISNEILKKFNNELLKKRKCSHCLMSKFHLIKLGCCNDFVCLSCFVQNSCEMENDRCIFCKKKFFGSNRNVFFDMIKNLILVVLRTMRVIDEEKEDGLDQKINEFFGIQIQKYSPCLNLHSLMQYTNPQLTLPKDIEKLDSGEFYFEKYLCHPNYFLMIINFVVNTLMQSLIQYLIGGTFHIGSYWNMISFSTVNIIVNQFHLINFGNFSPERLRKMEFNMNEFTKLVVTWLNLLLGYIIFREPLHEVKNFIFVTGISFTMVIWASYKVIQQFNLHVKEEQKYAFV